MRRRRLRNTMPGFMSGPFLTRVPFFLLFGFQQGDPKIQRAKRILLRKLDALSTQEKRHLRPRLEVQSLRPAVALHCPVSFRALQL